MNDQTDQQLLRAYAGQRSEPAFAELLRRHVDFVYSAALRMVRDAHLAQDVAQGVFVALAKNATGLADRPVLSGWLHRTAQNIAAQTVRTDVRRRAREQEVVTMNELLAAGPEADWEQIAPQLDTALGELGEADRDALLLRYFERKSAREMAQTLGVSEEAAQKRVNRAVERLREFLAKRGVTVGAGGLVVVISANAVQAAPVGLAVTISAAALAGTAATTSTLIAATTKTIAMTTLQKTLVTITVAVLAGAGIYEARQAAQLRDQVQSLQQQQAPLAEQIQQLQNNRNDATNQIADLIEELARAKRNNNELLRLRGEVSFLRRQMAELSAPVKASAAVAADQVTTTESVTNLALKVERLRYALDRMPYLKIPELALTTEKDWQLAAGCGGEMKTDEDFRWAFSQLRGIAEDHFGSMTMRALERFKTANNGQFPKEISQLLPFYSAPVDAAILQRYEIVPTSDLRGAHMDDEWAIATKVPVDRSDMREVIDSKGYGHSWSFYSPQQELNDATKQ